MTKFKVGDIVSAVYRPEGLYKIIKDTGTTYSVRLLYWEGVLVRGSEGEKNSDYKGVPYQAVTHPTLEQTILLTKLGLV